MNILQRFVAYLRHSATELQKVVWPSKEDLTRYTALVVGVTVISAVFFAALDGALNSAVTSLIAQRKAPISATVDPILPEEALQEIPTEASTSTPAEVEANPLLRN